MSLLLLGAMDMDLGRFRITIAEALTLDSLLMELQIKINSALIFT